MVSDNNIGKEAASDENSQLKSEIWFSHIEDRYNAGIQGNQKVFYWTAQLQLWD